MSRSGYSDECDHLNLYRHRVEQATKGKRGQKLLRDLLAALDAMPVKELTTHTFAKDGQFCTLGVLGAQRGIDLAPLEVDEDDDCDTRAVGKAFDIARPLAAEIMFMNDEGAYRVETPAQRWTRMRSWVASEILEAK